MRIAGRSGYSKSSSLLLSDTVLLMTLSTDGAPKADHPYLIDVDPESCYRRILFLLTLPLQYCRSLMLIKKNKWEPYVIFEVTEHQAVCKLNMAGK